MDKIRHMLVNHVTEFTQQDVAYLNSVMSYINTESLFYYAIRRVLAIQMLLLTDETSVFTQTTPFPLLQQFSESLVGKYIDEQNELLNFLKDDDTKEECNITMPNKNDNGNVMHVENVIIEYGDTPIVDVKEVVTDLVEEHTNITNIVCFLIEKLIDNNMFDMEELEAYVNGVAYNKNTGHEVQDIIVALEKDVESM